MAQKNAQELRETARRYRDMCANGCNTEIEEFMLLASEFEREAKSLEVRQNTDRLDRLAPLRRVAPTSEP
jgi:hypothetical protein